jgi:hypothetical protein
MSAMPTAFVFILVPLLRRPDIIARGFNLGVSSSFPDIPTILTPAPQITAPIHSKSLKI